MHGQWDPQVLRALEKWPNVPVCYGWLRLDVRGRWRIRDEIITHQRSIEFLSRNYSSDENGRWFVQNGPQRAYCTLDYTPWIYFLDGENRIQIQTHTALTADTLLEVYLDEGGNILFRTGFGVGLLVDRDLPRFLDAIEEQTADDDITERIAMLNADNDSDVPIRWDGKSASVRFIESALVPETFDFMQNPGAP